MKKCLNCMSEMAVNDPVCPLCGWGGQENEEGCLPTGTILQGRYIIGVCRQIRSADIQYMAWDALFSQKVYVMEYFPGEIVRRSGSCQVQAESGEEELLEKGISCFLGQKDLLVRLDGIHGLLNVLAGFQENHTAYMVLEYPGDRSLRDVLETEGPWDLARTKRLLKNLVRPLAAAYQNRTLHGQVTLDCCYLTGQGNFKIGFFNEALFLTDPDPDYQEEKAQRSADCFGLAHIVGAALVGVELWERQPVDDSIELLEETLPQCALDVLVDAMNEEVSCRIDSPQMFQDRFLDEVTVELPKEGSQLKNRKNMKNRGDGLMGIRTRSDGKRKGV